jgi:hypothetical protein
MRNRRAILLLAGLFMFAAPVAGRADSLFRLYPEFAAGGFYSNNVPLRSTNKEGDFAGMLIAGFYLDYTSAARYASLHYDTFAQLFAQQTQFDRAGEGQFVSVTDQENLSPTTKLGFEELFYKDAPTLGAVITSDQAPAFNNVANELLLANDQLSVNWFSAVLSHSWGRNWYSELAAHQSTYFNTSSGSGGTSFEQDFGAFTEYNFTNHFALGPGYRYYDFRFTTPGQPGQQAQEPYLRGTWHPLENFYLYGLAGIAITHKQGSDTQHVNPAGTGELRYIFHHAQVSVYGGQEPELSSLGAGSAQFVRGQIVYNFTQRLSATAGGGYYNTSGTNFHGKLISWGFRVDERVNRWLALYAGFTEIRRTVTAPNQALPTGAQNGQEATGDYVSIGMSISIEAARWSW